MDQQKIGRFLKQLRTEQNMTQEQLAELLGVSNRSVSRWERGATMPDFDLLIQLAKQYDVEIGELLEGERKCEDLDRQTEETMMKIANYNNAEKLVESKRLCGLFLAGIGAFLVFMVIDLLGLGQVEPYEDIASFMLGIVFGGLLMGALYTSRYMSRIRAAKLRLLGRMKN